MSEKEIIITNVESVYSSEKFKIDEYHAWEDLDLATLKRAYFKEMDNIEEVAVITYGNGDVKVKYEESLVFRTYFGPCIDSEEYDKLLPKILKYFGQQFWSPLSHEDLYHFKDYTAYEAQQMLNMDDYDNVVSPCHQLVMSALVCNDHFNVRLPDRIIIKILEFLPQTLFRCGDVMNYTPSDAVYEIITRFGDMWFHF